MLSKNKIKFIQSLSRKKVRDQEQLFLVEGNKIVLESIDSDFGIEMICATPEFSDRFFADKNLQCELIECSEDEIKKASLLQNPQQALALVKMPTPELSLQKATDKLFLALDFIQDPGNMGTIIRIADWFGIRDIICSQNTTDCFSPKVIQASMGAIFRTSIHYLNLEESLLKANHLDIPVYGAFLEGENIYQSPLSPNGILVMGNEGNGISEQIERFIDHKIHIPSFAGKENGSESLNVAVATSICCSEFKRRTIKK
ncbi:TrmH family RNA methyltransferase [Sunxiuqinia sp. A32]|uniref:TrmH family RNA methyltransferase n=1 Tax=Sunxiuqinia sp. A32 TaxID=3461496 RepID=UPI004045B429